MGAARRRDRERLATGIHGRGVGLLALTERLRERIATSAGADGAGIIEQIRRLGALHETGILTDEEFATKKAELLRRL